MAKILVVDDEVTVIKTLGVLLQTEGHTVVSETDAKKALKLLGEKPFDLLITDIRMQPFDGVELMTRVREIWPKLPIIVVSAYSSDSAIQASFDHGCIAYLAKPFKIEDVMAAVNKALGLNSQPSK